MDENNKPNDDGSLAGKVFDISDDLNISPVTDEKKPEPIIQVVKNVPPPPLPTPPPQIPITPPIPKPPVIPTPPPKPPTPPDIQPPKPPIPPTPPPTPSAPKPSAIPLQDISVPLQKAQSAQANQNQILNQPTPFKPNVPSTGNPITNLPNPANTVKTPIDSQIIPPQQIKQMGQQNTSQEVPLPPAMSEEEKFAKKALRTYESDVAEFMSHKRTSVASMAIAEDEKKKAQGQMAGSGQSSKKLLLVLISLIIIAIGGFGAYYLYSKSVLAPQTNTPNPTVKAETSLIPSQSQILIAVDGQTPAQILDKIKVEVSKPQQLNTIKEVVFTKTNEATVSRIDVSEMVEIMDIDVPNALIRSLEKPWMMGIYTDDNNNKDVFVAVTHNYFQNVFAGMLSWENFMADDLKQYLSESLVRGISNTPPTKAVSTTTTATTTPPSNNQTTAFEPYTTWRGFFTDSIIKNKDVRVFRINNGNTLFLYSFVDNNKLVFASRETTISKIISILEQQSFVR